MMKQNPSQKITHVKALYAASALLLTCLLKKLLSMAAACLPTACVPACPPASLHQIPNQRAAALKFANEPDRNMFFW